MILARQSRFGAEYAVAQDSRGCVLELSATSIDTEDMLELSVGDDILGHPRTKRRIWFVGPIEICRDEVRGLLYINASSGDIVAMSVMKKNKKKFNDADTDAFQE